MAHVRKQIRDNVVTTLTGLTTTTTNVYRTRVYPLASGKLPGLAIYTNSEISSYETLTIPRTRSRTLELMVEGYVSGTANLDNTLDTIAVEVEEAMETDVTRGGLAKDTQLTATEMELVGEGEKVAGVIRMTFEIMYFTREDDAEIAV
jgi:hypothetical protein